MMGWASLLTHAVFDNECALLTLGEEPACATLVIYALDDAVFQNEGCLTVAMGRLSNSDSSVWGGARSHCGTDAISAATKGKKLQVVNALLAKWNACATQ